ncbi:hypothetical protein RJT34_33567 [Clitoria ternatea]|uniref:Uncharacterized protein n=1 Tax=Clitoria ternatea TaxID=43366 RepID=A0AAN9EZ48_CLITE
MVGLGVQAQTYECNSDTDCERQCDPRGCLQHCLELPSICFKGIRACPFGPWHSSTKTLPSSICTLDGDCSKQVAMQVSRMRRIPPLLLHHLSTLLSFFAKV